MLAAHKQRLRRLLRQEARLNEGAEGIIVVVDTITDLMDAMSLS